MGQLTMVTGAWTCGRTEPRAVEHVSIPKEGLSVGTSSTQAWGTPGSSNFSSQTSLSGPSSSFPQHSALGVTVGLGGFVPLPPTQNSRTTATAGDLTVPTGAENQRPWAGSSQVLAEPPASDQLHRSVWMGLQQMPRRRFLLQMPFGKENHGLLELQEVARGGKAPAEQAHTCRGCCGSLAAQGSSTGTILGSSPHPCPGLQKPQ